MVAMDSIGDRAHVSASGGIERQFLRMGIPSENFPVLIPLTNARIKTDTENVKLTSFALAVFQV